MSLSVDSSIFKAYDIRGIVPDQIDAVFARALGHALAIYLKEKTGKAELTVAVGKDNRLSSDELALAVIEGMTSEGVLVIDIGLCSTPLFYFVVLHEKLDGGIMVTASHNPPQYGGFKMMGPGIIPIGGDSGMRELQKIMARESGSSEQKGAVHQKNLLPLYTDTCLSMVEPRDEIKNLSVVVDTGNGVSSLMVKALFDRLPCTLHPLFFELDGTFPSHLPNPLVEENIAVLKKTVVEKMADLGIALDTDGDRIVFVDEKGAMIPPDLMTGLLAQELLLAHHGESILFDLRSSKAVPEVIAESGGIPVVSRIGHTLIKRHMKDTHALFAGELSGHYYFRDMGNFEAPSLVILAILNLLVEKKKPLSELLRPLHRYFHTGEINFKVENAALILEKLEREFNGAKLTKLDGITIEYSDWWCNVRPSNTEPLLRLVLEAKTSELREEKRKVLEDIINNSL